MPRSPRIAGARRAAARWPSCASRRASERPQKLRATRLSIAFDGEDDRGHAADRLLRHRAGLEHIHVAPDDRRRRRRAGLPVPDAVREAGGRDDRARRSPGTIDVAGAIEVAPAPFDKDSLLFHAGWRARDVFPTRPFRDWHVAGIRGTRPPGRHGAQHREPARRRLVGRRRREDLRRRRGVPEPVRHRHRGLLRLRLVDPERFEHAYHAQTAPRRRRLRRALVDEPLPHPRPDPVHARAALRPRDLALDATTPASPSTRPSTGTRAPAAGTTFSPRRGRPRGRRPGRRRR